MYVLSSGEYYLFQETKITWRVSSRERCGNCLVRFHDPPAHIIAPTSQPSTVGLFGTYCSWNCAKRALFQLRTRTWFALLAITALQLGATLPIQMSESGKPPAPETKKVVLRQRIPHFRKNIVFQHSIHIGQLLFTHSTNTEIGGGEEGRDEEEGEPIAYESVSGIQSDAMMGV